MAALFCRSLPSLLNVSISVHNSTKQLCNRCHTFAGGDLPNKIVNSVCGSLRKGMNWDGLSRKYDSVEFNSTIVEEVLLKFKEPADAKRALSFFHWSSHCKKVEHGIRSYCFVIHILARARQTNDARALLESVLLKNGLNKDSGFVRFFIVDSLLDTYKATNSCPFVFDLLVQCCSKLRMFETAFDVICYLYDRGFSLNLISFNTLLYVIQKSPDRSFLVWKVYEHMMQRRVYPNENTVQIMISALCKQGELQKFLDIVDRIHGAYCKKGMVEEAGNLLEEMKDMGLRPYVETYNFLIGGCSKAGKLESGLSFCKEMLRIGLVPSPSAFNDMVKMLCEAGDVEQANEMLTLFIEKGYLPDEVTYFHLVSGYKKKGDVHEILKLYYEMEYRLLSPGLPVFTSLIEILCDVGKLEEADNYFSIMKSRSLEPTRVIYEKLMSKHFENGNKRRAFLLFTEMIEKGLKPCMSLHTLS